MACLGLTLGDGEPLREALQQAAHGDIEIYFG